VYLLEYDMKEGMIPLNEYSKIMTKAIHRVMKVGKKEILRVLRVDKEKGYIDLSKKSVFAEDEKNGE
jgi:translation initiation factor 2 subunit 1